MQPIIKDSKIPAPSAADTSTPVASEDPKLALEQALNLAATAQVDPNTPVQVETAVRPAAKVVSVQTAATMKDLVKAGAEQAMAQPVQPQQVQFMSRFPSLTLYVNLGRTETDKNGRTTLAPTRIEFKRGVFATSNPAVIAAMRDHPKCNTSTFRESATAELAALREGAAMAQERIKSATYSGASASSDGNEMAFMQQTAELAMIEQNLVSF